MEFESWSSSPSGLSYQLAKSVCLIDLKFMINEVTYYLDKI